jgi:nucleotide-binding universal stress UspA family protein
MFKKILLPLDLTEKHQAALKMAAELAGQNHGEALLVHVVEVIPGLSGAEERGFYQRLEQVARVHLGRLAAALTRKKVPVHTEIIVGQRVPEIVRFAAAKGVDLILLTSPTFQPEHPGAGLGSMAWKIGLVASCPVLLVKADGKEK